MYGLGSTCFSCTRLRSWMDDGAPTVDGQEVAFCAAFPGGIPDEIMYGFDHREPFGGEELDENGEPILFELDPEQQASLDAYEAVMESARGARGN